MLGAVLLGLVALPLLVAIISLVGYHWRPSSDVALEVLRIDDVGGRHTPLVGAQSRYDYFHPGPMLFWLLAPFSWLLGNTGILVGTALINAGAAIGSVLVGWRRGGPPLGVFVAIAVLLLCRALGAEALVTPWNPWVAVLPFLLFALLAWSVADRDWVVLPWCALVGSFVVQAHVGYLPTVAALGAGAAVLGLTRSFSDARAPAFRRGIVFAGAVTLLLWLAPAIQQLTGSPGNLGKLVDAFRDPAEPFVGWSSAFGIMGDQLAPAPAFVSRDGVNQFGLLSHSSTLPAAVLLGATSGLGALVWRRRASSAARLDALAVLAAVASVVAAARIIGIPAPYLVLWAWVVAAIVWMSVFWSVWSLLPSQARAAVMSVAVAVAVVLSGGVAWASAGVRPDQSLSVAIGELARKATDKLDPEPRYLVRWVDTHLYGSVGIGVFVALEQGGLHVRTVTGLSHAFGSWRTARECDVDRILTVVSERDIASGWRPPTDASRVASYEPRRRSEDRYVLYSLPARAHRCQGEDGGGRLPIRE